MSDYSIIFYETEKGRINIGAAIFDGTEIRVRFNESDEPVRRFCEIVGEPFPAMLGYAKKSFTQRLYERSVAQLP